MRQDAWESAERALNDRITHFIFSVRIQKKNSCGDVCLLSVLPFCSKVFLFGLRTTEKRFVFVIKQIESELQRAQTVTKSTRESKQSLDVKVARLEVKLQESKHQSNAFLSSVKHF